MFVDMNFKGDVRWVFSKKILGKTMKNSSTQISRQRYDVIKL